MVTLFIIAVILLYVAPRLAVFLILAGLAVIGILTLLTGGAFIVAILGIFTAILINS